MLAIRERGGAIVEALLELRDVVKCFPIYDAGIFRKKYRTLKAVDGVTFSLGRGTSFGIAGESGSGKSTVARLILLLEKATSGSILLEERDALRFTEQEIMWYRTRVQAVFQDAASSLNPRMRIEEIVSEPIEVHRNELPKKVIKARTREIIRLVGLSPDSLSSYPHELSGGQKQRVAIARAIVLHPSLVILDEPVSALDVSIRAQILNLLADIQEKQGLTYLIIAHDLAMLQHVSTQIAIMYLGKIVEMGDTQEVFSNPLHPYTKALFAAVPRTEPSTVRPAPSLSGEIGSALNLPGGCRFHPRCNYARPVCGEVDPSLQDVSAGHKVACCLSTIL
jgi:oligopeptide/dipeptide ABC transporter ATP-binding protein